VLKAETAAAAAALQAALDAHKADAANTTAAVQQQCVALVDDHKVEAAGATSELRKLFDTHVADFTNVTSVLAEDLSMHTAVLRADMDTAQAQAEAAAKAHAEQVKAEADASAAKTQEVLDGFETKLDKAQVVHQQLQAGFAKLPEMEQDLQVVRKAFEDHAMAAGHA